MIWNWQQPDWPNFRWEHALLRKAEEYFLMGAGVLAGTFKHLSESDREQVTIDAMSTEAVTTSEIEGEILDRASVQSSIRRKLALTTDKRRMKPSEEGISEMMVNLYRSFADPLSDAMLFTWHRMLFEKRGGLRDLGKYRTGDEPMEIVSGRIGETQVHFEAPPSTQVPDEMARFLKWFNRTAPSGNNPLATLTRAAIAHLYFESIHPFEDGNGRIGRAVAEKAIAQTFSQPMLMALAATILLRRNAYYTALEAANKSNEVTPWVCWFAGIAIETQRRTTAHVEFLLERTRLLDRLRVQLNQRQEKALLRMFREGPDGFKGGLSAGNYGTITGASPATATRDLADLVKKGALRREGERRHARYHLAIRTVKVSPVMLDERGNFE